MKKPFKETKVGKFLSEKGSAIVDIVGDFVPPVEILSSLINNDPKMTIDEINEANKILMEEYRLELEDKQNARSREVELAKTGKSDHLMYATGYTGLVSFIAIIAAILFMPELEENRLFVHLMGLLEGVVVSSLFSYYFGTSKGSKDKQQMLNKLKGV